MKLFEDYLDRISADDIEKQDALNVVGSREVIPAEWDLRIAMWDNTVVKLNLPNPKLTKKILHYVDMYQYVDDWLASGSERELEDAIELYPEHVSINESMVNLYVNFSRRTYYSVMSFILTLNNLLYGSVSYTVMSPKWIAGTQQATTDPMSRRVVSMLTDADGNGSYEPEVERIYEIVSAIVDPDVKHTNIYSGFQAWLLPRVFKRIVQRSYHALPVENGMRSFPVNVKGITYLHDISCDFTVYSKNIYEHFIKLALIHYAFRNMSSCGYLRDFIFRNVDQFLEYGPQFILYVNTNSRYSIFKTLRLFFGKEVIDELDNLTNLNISPTDEEIIEHINIYTDKLREMLIKPMKVNPLIA